MSNVIPFAPSTATDHLEERIWVCSCGCSSFELVDPGHLKCALCKTYITPDGGWHRPTDTMQSENTYEEEPVRVISGNDSVDFAKRLLVARVSMPDTIAAVVIRGMV